MDNREKLEGLFRRIDTLPIEYIERSLYKDFNELMFLCDNIIENNVKNIIEIGTYWGVAAAIFASIIDGTVHTINIDEQEIFRSKVLWENLDIKNIIQLEGSSLDKLPEIVDSLSDVGFVYVDGNHDVPYAMKEFEMIKNSKISEGNCFVYFDDGPLAGVQQAIETHNLTTISGTDWMIEDEKNKGGSGTLKAYAVFGDFRLKI